MNKANFATRYQSKNATIKCKETKTKEFHNQFQRHKTKTKWSLPEWGLLRKKKGRRRYIEAKMHPIEIVLLQIHIFCMVIVCHYIQQFVNFLFVETHCESSNPQCHQLEIPTRRTSTPGKQMGRSTNNKAKNINQGDD